MLIKVLNLYKIILTIKFSSLYNIDGTVRKN